MSISAVKWAFKQEGLSLAERMVLVRLAEYADNDGGSIFPQQKDVAKECSLSRGGVNRAISGLQKKGLLTVCRGRVRNSYQINFEPSDVTEDHISEAPDVTYDHISDVTEDHSVTEDYSRCNRGSHLDVTEDHTPYKKPPYKPPRTHHEYSHPDAFEEFWKAYPHPQNRGSKKKARERWATRVKDPPAVMRGVAHYAAYCASEAHWYSPKMAEGWLNGENWESWQEPPKHEHTRTIDADRIDAIVNGRDPDAGHEVGEHVWPEIERQGDAGPD